MTLLLDHVVILLVLLPLIGAAVLTASARWGTEASRWSALSNIGLSLLLAVAMVLHYDPDLRTPAGRPVAVQMETSLPWLGTTSARPPSPFPLTEEEVLLGLDQDPAGQLGPNVRLAFGADGITLWLLALLPWLMLGTWACLPRGPEASSGDLVRLLLTQASAAAVFAARDAALLAFAGGCLSLCLASLSGLWDYLPERREAARRLLLGHWLSDLLLLAATAGLVGVVMRMQMVGQPVPLPPPFDLDLLTFGTAFVVGHDPHRLVWGPMEGWLFTAFVLAIALKLPLFPFHRRVAISIPELRPGTRGLATVLPLLVGTYLGVRFLVPLFPSLLAGHGVWLVALLLVGLWGASLSMSREDDPRRGTTFLAVAAGALAAIGIVSFSVEGLLGGVLLAIAAAVGLLAMSLLADGRGDAGPSRRDGPGQDASGEHSASTISHWGSFATALEEPIGQVPSGGRDLLGLPAAAAFAAWPGTWLVLLGISRNAMLLPGKLFLGLPLLLAPLVIAGLSLVRWAQRMRDLPATQSLPRGVATMGVCLVVAVGIGAPWMLSRTEPTVARYLRQELPVNDSTEPALNSSYLPRATQDARTAELTVEVLP